MSPQPPENEDKKNDTDNGDHDDSIVAVATSRQEHEQRRNDTPPSGRASRGRRERTPRKIQSDDLVNSRDGKEKVGHSGNRISLLANYAEVKRIDAWCLFQYRVDFDPDVESTPFRKGLLKQHTNTLPAYIFDGASLYTSTQLGDELLDLAVTNQKDQTSYKVKLKLVAELEKHDTMYLQFYNILARKCLQMLDMVLLGRNFFNQTMAIPIHNHGLEIWPGFLTTIRQHDQGLLYCVQSLHKVLRTQSIYSYLNNTRQEVLGRGGNMDRVKEAIRTELIGTTILTHYNNKTYRVDDVAWGEKPTSTFEHKGTQISFIDYYMQRYNIQIEYPNQPLLISNPKKTDIHRGQTTPCKLIPELCFMTGLTDAMRQNFGLMKDLGQFLFQPPQKKMETVHNFLERIRSTTQVQEELRKWSLQIGTRMIEIPGRQLPIEAVCFKDRGNQLQKVPANEQGDFTQAFRNFRMTVCVPLQTWVCIVPGRDFQNVDNLVRTMQQVSRSMGFNIDPPTEVIRLQGIGASEYLQAVNKAIERYNRDLQLVMTILPNNRLELYAAIKKRCYVDHGISSQCFVAKNMTSRGLMSIATKLTVQMNCKLGGEAWQGVIPLKKTMVVGFDVHHGGVGSKSPSIGAMVATISESYGRYYSTVTTNKSREEVTGNMGVELIKCVQAYKDHNEGALPERIMFYRDGVGEGQLQFVFEEEIQGIKKLLGSFYKDNRTELPKVTFIVVTKRTNARLFTASRGNPPPGTIVDDGITLPERYDFYLIAQSVRQGTVSPTSYNVLWDKSDLDPDKIQRLTYKLCHLYYNWSGTVAVPAPCQYAHKLAYLTGIATKAESNAKLGNLLYFL